MNNSDDLLGVTLQQWENKAFDAIQRIFPCELDLMDKIPLDAIIDTFKSEIIPKKAPFLVRLAGQSGSGKSSQLFPALEYALKDKTYIAITVGRFASFHPKYTEWQKNCPELMREKTNGFALRALVLFYRYCIENRCNIVLDMTLLEPEIDMYLMILAKKMGYKIQIHVLCVPKRVSDRFIRMRQRETGRCVKISSSRYFFQALAPCLSFLTRSRCFSSSDMLVLWSHYLMRPIKKTHLNNPSVMCLLQRYQQGPFILKKEKRLVTAKKYWLKHLMESWNV